ncbi:hypothetical protein [Acetobacter oeni]|nr:hypothetical protein [Acetobacter oeni]MBB3883486.1 hypothetical protein [Acetobacter oeni]
MPPKAAAPSAHAVPVLHALPHARQAGTEEVEQVIVTGTRDPS